MTSNLCKQTLLSTLSLSLSLSLSLFPFKKFSSCPSHSFSRPLSQHKQTRPHSRSTQPSSQADKQNRNNTTPSRTLTKYKAFFSEHTHTDTQSLYKKNTRNQRRKILLQLTLFSVHCFPSVVIRRPTVGCRERNAVLSLMWFIHM